MSGNTYGYDSLYRLTDVLYPDNSTESYTYDAAGNRLTHKTAQGTTSYTYNDENQLATAGDFQYSYDANGNLVGESSASGTVEYVYDDESQLTTVKKDSQEVASYDYDVAGRRIATHHGTDEIQYLWDGYALLSEYTSSGTLKTQYCNGGRIDEVLAIQNTATYYVHPDHLGSISAATAVDGTVAFQQDYGPFGEIAHSTGSLNTSRGFTGRELDSETGLLYYRARFYDPQIGRFLIQDPLRDGLNYYGYCGSNPISYIDSSGEVSEVAALILLGNSNPITAPVVDTVVIVGAVAVGVTIVVTHWDDVVDFARRVEDRVDEATDTIEDTYTDYKPNCKKENKPKSTKKNGAPRNRIQQNEQARAIRQELLRRGVPNTPDLAVRIHRIIGGKNLNYQDALEACWEQLQELIR